jgi:hypothetical protein
MASEHLLSCHAKALLQARRALDTQDVLFTLDAEGKMAGKHRWYLPPQRVSSDTNVYINITILLQ